MYLKDTRKLTKVENSNTIDLPAFENDVIAAIIIENSIGVKILYASAYVLRI
jgi:hypothetical protein